MELGSIVATPVTGVLTTRIGCKKVILAAGIVLAAVLPLLAVLDDWLALAAALAVFGAAVGTIDVAMNLQRAAEKDIGRVPFVLAINKVDLADQWRIERGHLELVAAKGWKVLRTSAKTGEGVEEAFMILARAMASR